MFISYLSDMKSWILLFVLSLGFADALIWLDPGIDAVFTSVLYFNVLLIVILALFIIWRYRVEMKFTKELAVLAEEQTKDWQEAMPETIFLRDKVTSGILQQAIMAFSRELADLRREIVVESDYTAAWVHEVKTPLTAMKMTMDAQRENPAIRKIEKEWLRVHLLIDQQLYISRLPTLEADYVLEKANLHRLAKAEVRELATWCMEKNVAVEFEGEELEVVTDVKWNRFIIRQILTNAVKYSPEGGTISISTEVNSLGHPFLKIKDEGPGIESHDLPRVFEKGFTGGTGRLHNAATGMGLYLAQTVAGKIGLALTAQSVKGQGTIICMIFSIENDFDKTITGSQES